MQVHWIIQVDWLTSCSKCAWKKLSQASRQMGILLSLSGSVSLSCNVLVAECSMSRFNYQIWQAKHSSCATSNCVFEREKFKCVLVVMVVDVDICRCRNWSPGQLRSLLRPLSRWGWKCLLVALLCCAAGMYRFCWGPSPPCNHGMVVSKFPESKTNKNTAKSSRSRIIKTICESLIPPRWWFL